MSRKFIIPTKENKIAILCKTKEQWFELCNCLMPDQDNLTESRWKQDNEGLLLLPKPHLSWVFDFCTSIKWAENNGYKVILFENAIIQNRSYLAKILSVEDEQEFIWRNQIYRVAPCAGTFSIQIKRDTGWSYVCTHDFESIIQWHNEIKFPIDFEIIGFIKQFRNATELFAYGMCYWFAHILYNRFENSSIEYHPIDNHFSCRIKDVNYDITGVIDGYGYVNWDEYQKFDPVHAERIKKYCIRKED